MAKEIEIEVVQIDLGIDIKEEIMKASRSISSESKKVAEEIIAKQVEKKTQKEAAKKEKDTQKAEWETKLDACHGRLLAQMNEEDPLVSAEELMLIADTEDLTGLMLRIRNFMKRINSKFKLEKRKKQKKTHYALSSG